MKKIILLLLILAIAGLGWYLFIKKYDYQFQTTAKYGPGAVFYELTGWEKINSSQTSGKIAIIDKKPFSYLTQRMYNDSSVFVEMEWELEKLNDTTTALNLNVLSEKNQLANRWDIINPFKKSEYIDSLTHAIKAFKKLLKEHQEAYRIKPDSGLVKSPSMNCICHSSKNIFLDKKAEEMMATISLLEDYILSNKLKLKSYPFLKIKKWDREKDLIDFDFCFPLEDIDGLQEASGLKIKEYPSQESLRVIFNGNYRLSHIAWFDILNLAKERGYKTNGLPMEIFFDNPKIDVDELNWKTEVYLPVHK